MRQGTQTGPYAGGVRGPGVRTNPPFRRHTLNYVRTKLREASPHARRILHGPVHDAQRGYADYRSVLGSMNCEAAELAMAAPVFAPLPQNYDNTVSRSALPGDYRVVCASRFLHMLQEAWCFLSRFQTQTRVDADFQSFLSFREYAIFAAAFTPEQDHSR